MQSLEELCLSAIYDTITHLNPLEARDQLVRFSTILLESILKIAKTKYLGDMSLETNKLDILITIKELIDQRYFYLCNSDTLFGKCCFQILTICSFMTKNEIIDFLECLPEIMIEHLRTLFIRWNWSVILIAILDKKCNDVSDSLSNEKLRK